MRGFTSLLIVGMICLMPPMFAKADTEDNARGAVLYRQHCHKCHSSPAKMAQHENIISYMRKPRFSMPKFTTYDLSDDEARAIESYIKSWAGK